MTFVLIHYPKKSIRKFIDFKNVSNGTPKSLCLFFLKKRHWRSINKSKDKVRLLTGFNRIIRIDEILMMKSSLNLYCLG